MSPEDLTETGDADALWAQAADVRDRQDYAAAIGLFDAFARAHPDHPKAPKAVSSSLYCRARSQQWDDLEAAATALLAQWSDFAFVHFYLGQAALELGRPEEAIGPLSRALEISPADTEARNLLTIARSPSRGALAKIPIARWPTRQRLFAHLSSIIRTSVLPGVERQRFIAKDASFLTLGSCFAVNLARRLEVAGRKAVSEMISEEVNSPLANRHMLDWIVHGPSPGPTQVMHDAFGPEVRARMREGLQAADVVVVTLGVAPAFVDRETGEFVFMQVRSRASAEFLFNTSVMRTPTVAESVDNIRSICRSIRDLARPHARIVLTLSPVPIGATNEMGSAVIADALSKSTLRLACHEVVQAPDSGVLYWPSFEIVRWLGAHLGTEQPPAFGLDDGGSRHVSNWLVDLIVAEFLVWYGVERARPET